MKVRVTLTVDIDTEAWEANYGVSGADDIREDVQSYVRGMVYDFLENQDLLVHARDPRI